MTAMAMEQSSPGEHHWAGLGPGPMPPSPDALRPGMAWKDPWTMDTHSAVRVCTAHFPQGDPEFDQLAQTCVC